MSAIVTPRNERSITGRASRPSAPAKLKKFISSFDSEIGQHARQPGHLLEKQHCVPAPVISAMPTRSGRKLQPLHDYLGTVVLLHDLEDAGVYSLYRTAASSSKVNFAARCLCNAGNRPGGGELRRKYVRKISMLIGQAIATNDSARTCEWSIKLCNEKIRT
ncbi:hypothetical protein [Bradyrhizobium valentinum]|uniref:hypothetical protein n=1 Tax=Bradyrhizobium valentinum TaxID=1518501 RepID=UPI0012E3D3D8|nr:hypothetical protein [Bradyrhizobium valentinum]